MKTIRVPLLMAIICLAMAVVIGFAGQGVIATNSVENSGAVLKMAILDSRDNTIKDMTRSSVLNASTWDVVTFTTTAYGTKASLDVGTINSEITVNTMTADFKNIGAVTQTTKAITNGAKTIKQTAITDQDIGELLQDATNILTVSQTLTSENNDAGGILQPNCTCTDNFAITTLNKANTSSIKT
ncbi:MAG: hypothetical protein ABSE68_02295 [Minisyncoccia bacterium]